MSDNIPLEIQMEIIKKLPVKPLIQFRSVSKTWKSLIDSSDFVASYSSQDAHILVRHDDRPDENPRYVSIVDDNTFPTQKVSLSPPPPLLLNECKSYYGIAGCSHGMFCFYHAYPNKCVTGKALIWNPSIRKAVDVVVPNVANGDKYAPVLGFGVCQETNDPKIVKIIHIVSWSDIESASCIPWQVEVFTLSTWAWRSLDSNLPRKSVLFDCCSELNSCSVAIDGVLYWFAIDRVTVDGERRPYNLIISFDLTSEEFGEIKLPNTLANRMVYDVWFIKLYITMSKLRGSFVVLEKVQEASRAVYDVWMLEGGESFTKLFSFDVNTLNFARAMGFRKSGEPLLQIYENDDGQLVVYDPHTKRIDNLGIHAMEFSYFVHPYMETLFLLDQPNSYST